MKEREKKKKMLLLKEKKTAKFNGVNKSYRSFSRRHEQDIKPALAFSAEEGRKKSPCCADGLCASMLKSIVANI